LFQLVYLYCTAPRADTTAFAAYQARVRGMLQNRSASPEAAFGDTVQVTLAQHHFRARPWSEELVEEMDLEKSLRIYRERFGEAGDFTFFLVGNFALEQIEPLVRRYLGGLPSSGRRESWRDVRLEPPKGVVEKYVYRGLEEKSQTQIVFTGPFVWNYENFFTIHALAGVLRIKLREVLREDLGGTYGVGVGVSTEHYPNQEYSLSIGFGCAPERVEELSEVVFAQLDSLQRFGPGESYVQKVQEMQRRRHELRLRENSFWLDWLDMSAFHGLDPGLMLRYGEFVEGLSARAMQEAARQYFNQENYVRVVLLPEKYK
jgi:zinc protease